jgi:autotransporter-associated beta strand protein
MTGSGVVIVQANSVFTGPTLTSGAFGTGTLSIGATKMRARNSTGDITVGNAITFTDNPTFATTTTEESLIFTGNASLGATRTLTVDIGSTVVTEALEFSGQISGSGFGITKEGAGNLVLSGINTYDGATLVNAGTLFATGLLASDVSVSDAATLGGGGTVGAVSFAGGSFFDIALAIGGNALDSTATISFSSAGFGIDNLVFNGAAVDWSTIVNNTYTLISGNLDETLLDNFGSGSAFGIGGGRTAYFEEGSLNLVVIPEPRAALLGGLGLLALLRRRR